MKRIYLDHAATTPTDPVVLEAMTPWFRERFGNPSSLHSFGREGKVAVETARRKVAALLGAWPDEVVFTSGGTESNNTAIRGVAGALRERGNHAKKNRVVVGKKTDLLAPGLVADMVNLLVDELPGRAVAKIRYAHRGAPCAVALRGDRLRVVFNEPQDAITPGQSVVLYDGNIVLGGGIIREALT